MVKAVEELERAKDREDEQAEWGERFGDPPALHVAGLFALALGLNEVLAFSSKVRPFTFNCARFAFALRSLCVLCAAALSLRSLCASISLSWCGATTPSVFFVVNMNQSHVYILPFLFLFSYRGSLTLISSRQFRRRRRRRRNPEQSKQPPAHNSNLVHLTRTQWY